MKLLKIKAYQLFANYRKPLSYNYWDTYPLPPFSTIRGWFHYVVWNGYKDGNRHYIPMSMSIQGKFDGVVQDLQTLIKFDRRDKVKGKGYKLLKGFKKAFKKSPIYVANVCNINLTIYLYSEEEYLQKFKENIFKVNYNSLGRWEDLLRIDLIDFIEPKKMKFSPRKSHVIDYGIYLNKKTADKLGIKGINYRMNFRYNGNLLEKTGLRYFKKKDVVYIDNDIIKKGEFFIDDTEANEYNEGFRIIDLVGDFNDE